MRNPRNQAFSISPHLNETQLIAYLDGELPSTERESARDHLDSCWTCRSLLGDVQSSIEAFLEVRTALLPEESAFAESRVEQFRQRLARHASAADAQVLPWGHSLGLRFQNAASFLWHPRQAVIAGVLVVTLLVVMFTDVLNTRVSADTVLARADQYETSHAPGRGQVNRISLRVERIDRASKRVKLLGTVTVVRDSALPEEYVQAQSASGGIEKTVIDATRRTNGNLLHALLPDEDASLVRYLNSQQWLPDLSAAEFRRLAGGQGIARSSARREGEAIEVSYQFAAGHPSGLAEALLQVDAHDYAPTGLSLVTADQNSAQEYRFTRTSVASEARTTEIAGLFTSHETTTELSSRTRELPPLPKPVPLSYGESSATVSEVKAAEVLHSADACLGEEVYLFPMSDGTLLVQGLVDTVARRAAIERTLKPLTGVRVEIYLPREIKSGSDLFNPPERFEEKISSGSSHNADTTLADLSSGQSPLYERLNQHFSQPGVSPEDAGKQVAIFSNEVVTTARQTFLHAWALKRLDGEFSKARTAGLPDAALQAIERMREDHRRWIATLAQRESEMLTPFAGSPLATDATKPAGGEVDTDALLRLAQEQNQLVRALFAPSQQTNQADANLTRLLAVVRRMGA